MTQYVRIAFNKLISELGVGSFKGLIYSSIQFLKTMNKETPKEEAQRMRDESHREEELDIDKLRKENEAFKINNEEIPYDMPECDTN